MTVNRIRIAFVAVVMRNLFRGTSILPIFLNCAEEDQVASFLDPREAVSIVFSPVLAPCYTASVPITSLDRRKTRLHGNAS